MNKSTAMIHRETEITNRDRRFVKSSAGCMIRERHIDPDRQRARAGGSTSSVMRFADDFLDGGDAVVDGQEAGVAEGSHAALAGFHAQRPGCWRAG